MTRAWPRGGPSSGGRDTPSSPWPPASSSRWLSPCSRSSNGGAPTSRRSWLCPDNWRRNPTRRWRTGPISACCLALRPTASRKLSVPAEPCSWTCSTANTSRSTFTGRRTELIKLSSALTETSGRGERRSEWQRQLSLALGRRFRPAHGDTPRRPQESGQLRGFQRGRKTAGLRRPDRRHHFVGRCHPTASRKSSDRSAGCRLQPGLQRRQ